MGDLVNISDHPRFRRYDAVGQVIDIGMKERLRRIRAFLAEYQPEPDKEAGPALPTCLDCIYSHDFRPMSMKLVHPSEKKHLYCTRFRLQGEEIPPCLAINPDDQCPEFSPDITHGE